MSAIPFNLPYGYVAVYGLGTTEGQNVGLTTGNTIFKFATIYYIGANMSNSMIGESILFDSREEVCQLAWDNFLYPVVPANKIIGTEDSL